MSKQNENTTKESSSGNTKDESKMDNEIVLGDFVLGKTLGKGTFGKVKLGIHRITGEKVILFFLYNF